MRDAKYDIVVFGATSFVGQILCRYLAERHGTEGKLRWALAGRSEDKLKSIRDELGAGASHLPLIVADAHDKAALDRMCADTNVVVSTVGPYALYGSPLVQACVESGTDYCDLTGEAHWVREMLDAHEGTARKSGARIVNCCGFDSIPSDLGVQFLQEQTKQRLDRYCNRIKMRVKVMRGGLSGGTAASMMNVAKQARRDPALRKKLADPYLLCPADRKPTVRQPNVNFAEYCEDLDRWTAPFIMATMNTRVVHRSHALAGQAYGPNFLYDEAVATGKGPRGRIAAMGIASGLAGFLAAAALEPTRAVLERFVLPKPGEGPSRQQQEHGFFDLRFIGKTEAHDTLHAKVTGDRDPGYGSTAKMLGEAAACLARDVSRSEVGGGFWTPATAMGGRLRDRLTRHAGLAFELLD